MKIILTQTNVRATIVNVKGEQMFYDFIIVQVRQYFSINFTKRGENFE